MRRAVLSFLMLSTANLASPATVADWVQWAADGGNHQFYRAVLVPGGLSWEQASAAAGALGGQLVTIGSAGENAFVYGLVSSGEFWYPSGGHFHGPWLGGFQPGGSPEPGGNWQWVTGETWSYSNWFPGQPDNYGGDQNRLIFYNDQLSPSDRWDDLNEFEAPIRGFVVERPTPPCPGDLDHDGVVSQSDLGILLQGFGCTAGVGRCAGDLDADGDTDQGDLGELLAAFGTNCP